MGGVNARFSDLIFVREEGFSPPFPKHSLNTSEPNTNYSNNNKYAISYVDIDIHMSLVNV